jgi:hypothetical protein
MMNRFLPLAVLLMSVAPASAQQSGPVVNEKALSPVTVFDDRGVRTPGRLLRIDPESVVVLVNGQERRFELEHVTKVEKRGDSLRNGAIIGAVVGAVFGAATGGMSDCVQPGDTYAECGAGTRIAMAAVSAGMFAAIGAGFDAAIQGHSTLYQRPASGAPAARGPSASVRFNLRW